MTAAPIHLAGERLLLDPAGAAYWPAARTLIVADLHLEKGSAAASKGSLLPPWDTRATLEILAALLRNYRPARVIALGDSFHDAAGATRLLRDDRVRLVKMADVCAFVWVLGNHDPTPSGLPGEFLDVLTEGPFTFRHQAAVAAHAEMSGHFHPKASVPVRGTVVTRPCFVVDHHRLLLPALGTYTGGLDITDPAISALFLRGGRAFLLGRDRLFSFALSAARQRAVATW